MVFQLETPRTIVGPQTVTATTSVAGPHYVEIEATLPGAMAQGNGAGSAPSGSSASPVSSSIIITVKQNTVTKFTSTALTPQDRTGSLKFKVPLNCAASDAIEIDIVSSAVQDNQLNSVRSTIMIGQGQ